MPAVKVAEAALFASVNVQGSASRSIETDTTLTVTRSDQASAIVQATVPIYDGGMAASQVRQAKEMLAQNRLMLDQVRLQTDTAVATMWATHEGARISMNAAEAEVRAATAALSGVQQEHQAGQRTTLDVLNSQLDLTGARARLIQAQRDLVVTGYTLLGALGRLDHKLLGLPTVDYEPQSHYFQVRDAWHGLRTPSGQ